MGRMKDATDPSSILQDLLACLAKVNLISSKSLPIVPLKGIAGTAARSHQLSLVQARGMRLNATPHKVVKRHSVATKS